MVYKLQQKRISVSAVIYTLLSLLLMTSNAAAEDEVRTHYQTCKVHLSNLDYHSLPSFTKDHCFKTVDHYKSGHPFPANPPWKTEAYLNISVESLCQLAMKKFRDKYPESKTHKIGNTLHDNFFTLNLTYNTLANDQRVIHRGKPHIDCYYNEAGKLIKHTAGPMCTKRTPCG